MKKFVMTLVAASVVSGGIAFAASHGAMDPVKMRKDGMQTVGLAMGQVAGMAKGQVPFDPKGAVAAFKAMNYVSGTIGQFFPEGSDMAADTTAAPAIWEDMDGFNAALAKFQADTAAAIEMAPASPEDLGKALGMVGGNCKDCHEKYRVKKG
ncbi:MAG: cytochrome c [Nitratireductor sp.]|nr:cytochrome c [Nitratireductor sp.]MCC0020544.1 cytochrome c [Nitratireductor sp.]